MMTRNVKSALLQQVNIRLDTGLDHIVLAMPGMVKSMTMNWSQLFNLGDVIGQNAFLLPPMPTSMLDHVAANSVFVTQVDDQRACITFANPAMTHKWGRETALLVAEKLCDFAITMAEKLNIKRGYKCGS